VPSLVRSFGHPSIRLELNVILRQTAKDSEFPPFRWCILSRCYPVLFCIWWCLPSTMVRISLSCTTVDTEEYGHSWTGSAKMTSLANCIFFMLELGFLGVYMLFPPYTCAPICNITWTFQNVLQPATNSRDQMPCSLPCLFGAWTTHDLITQPSLEWSRIEGKQLVRPHRWMGGVEDLPFKPHISEHFSKAVRSGTA